MLKKIIIQSFNYSVVLVASKAFSIIYIALAARILDKSNFGTFSFFVMLSQLITTLTDLGLRQWYMKAMVERSNKNLLSRILETRLVTALITIAILFFTNNWWPKLPMEIFWCLGASLVLEVFFTVADAHYLYNQQSTRVGWKSFWRNLGMVILWLPMTKLLNPEMTYQSMYILYLIATTVVAILYFPFKEIRKFAPMIHTGEMVKVWKKTSIYGISDGLSVAYSKIDGLVIERLLNTAAFGVYSGTYRVLDGINLVPQALYHNLFRVTAKKDAFSIAQLWKITALMAAAGVAVGGILFWGAPIIANILLGEKYPEAVGLLRIFAVVAVLFFINAPLNTVIQSSSYLKKYLPIFGGVIGVNIVLNLLFIKYGGLMGAAQAMIVSQIILIIVNAVVIYRDHTRGGQVKLVHRLREIV
jgi:O-antigen/teichoic acid export membrane protein